MKLLDDYLFFTHKQASPKCYHKWVCLSMAAACLERRVWVDRKFYKVFPNLYVMLIGDTAAYMKSTSIEMGRDLAWTLKDRPNFYEGQITAAQLAKDMSGGGFTKNQDTEKFVKDSRASKVTIVAPELSLFLRNKELADETIDFLTDFYTCKTKTWKSRTKTQGCFDIEDACINFIAGSTSEWLAKGLSESDFGGGFMGRCLFIVPDVPPRKVAHPSFDDEQSKARDRVLDVYARLRTLKGEYTLTQPALDYYEKWYNALPIPSPTDRLKGYIGRKPETILKLALIKAATEDSLEIGIEEIEWALGMLAEIEPTMGQAFQFLGTEENVMAELIIAHITMMGGRDYYSRVLTYMAPRLKNKPQFDAVITMLVEQHRIKKYEHGGWRLALSSMPPEV